MEVRIDKWLWAVRICKTRSDGADACRSNRVWVNGTLAKPSRDVRVGDVVGVRKGSVVYSFRILVLVANRQPAKSVMDYVENITPQEELDKLNVPKESIFVHRERGTGRPTKKDRRDLDSLMDGLILDDDNDDHFDLEQ